MISEKDVAESLVEQVADRISVVIRDSLANIIEVEVSKAFNRAAADGQIQRILSGEVIAGIESIYLELSSTRKDLATGWSKDSLNLLSETDNILDGVVQATERATLKILDHLESIQEGIRQIRQDIEGGLGAQTGRKLDRIDKLLIDTMTELSFQDLTGQQVRRVVQSLQKVEKVISEVYSTTEIIKGRRKPAHGKPVGKRKPELAQKEIDKILKQT